jgi:hypothetical protein
MPESAAFDRIAFASCLPRNRTASEPSREKPGHQHRSQLSSPFSAGSGLLRKNCEMRALFAYSGAECAELLCTSDCMAEREGLTAQG